ncbi:hypothetical protein ACE6H2_003073 [Prunus campanulata]
MSLSSNYYCNLLKLCCQAGNHAQAKKLHCHIIKTITSPETFLLNNIVTTYGRLGNLRYARHVFDQMPHPTLFSWNAILSVYSKSGYLSEMQEIFDLMPRRDGVSWNSFISGHASCGLLAEAVKVYSLMLRDGAANLNRITFSTMLVLCSSQRCANLGRQLHGHIVKFGFESYVFVGSPLVDMYSKTGLILDAQRVFDSMPERNVVMYNTLITGLLRRGLIEDSECLFSKMPEKDSISWTTMITGLTQNGSGSKALDKFREMILEGLGMDQYTFGSVLTACGGLFALEEGKQVHAYIIRTELIDNIFVGSALVDMYCKCRSIKAAEGVFKRMSYKNVVSWTAMLVGYGQNGYSEEAVRVFCDMQRKGVEPDDFTLGSVISSCANLASLEEGAQFHGQALASGLISFITVSNALVTLYGKCGSIEDSHRLFNEMNIRDEVSWTALVSGYAQFGKAYETIDLFERMLAHADDQSSPFSDQIYAKLEKLNCKMIEEGYEPDMSSVLHDVEESEKKKMLNYHSEKLAIAFGLIFLPAGVPIRVVKNLRVCGDCHNATKYISKITKREILVRDAVRYHLFKDGTCSCGDFW